ncbi:Uncharacterised protein [Vibrio cholerae]|nr:Uncharacterised protein [Vibrio cholerae]CSB39560.1 Uncharacterised protein [Vibrio cholerae]
MLGEIFQQQWHGGIRVSSIKQRPSLQLTHHAVREAKIALRHRIDLFNAALSIDQQQPNMSFVDHIALALFGLKQHVLNLGFTEALLILLVTQTHQ